MRDEEKENWPSQDTTSAVDHLLIGLSDSFSLLVSGLYFSSLFSCFLLSFFSLGETGNRGNVPKENVRPLFGVGVSYVPGPSGLSFTNESKRVNVEVLKEKERTERVGEPGRPDREDGEVGEFGARNRCCCCCCCCELTG